MLFIRPIQARLTRQTNILLSMDPYCILIYEGKQYRTNPHVGGGQKPKWNDTLSFDIMTINVLRIEVWSRSIIGNDALIGRAEVDLRRLMLVPGRTTQQHIELFFENKSAGKILIELTFAAQAFKKKPLLQQKQLAPQRMVLPPTFQGVKPIDGGQMFQQQKFPPSNRFLPPQAPNGRFFPPNPRLNNPLYGSQVLSSEQDLIKNMQKMNLNSEYFDAPKQNVPPQVVIPPGQMPGLTHRRAPLQRPTTPQYQLHNHLKNGQGNGIAITQPLHQSLPLFNNNSQQSLIEQKPYEQIKEDVNLRNSFGFRNNRLISHQDKIENVKIQEKPIKPILSKGKDRPRSRSNKKVSFNV